MNEKRKSGFTLMEMLVVVAIIAVLIAIAIPLFSSALDNARKSTDLSNMRSAYAAAMAEWTLEAGESGEHVYYFNGSGVSENADGISGYGKSNVDASTFSDNLPAAASGIPNENGSANLIRITVNADGTAEILWGSPGSGFPVGRVTTPTQYKSLEKQDKLDRDTAMLDALQANVRTMSYSDLKALMDKYGIRPETAWGHSCYKIALSCIDSETGEIVQSKNSPMVKELFDAAGYELGDDPSKQYIFLSSGLNNVSAENYEVSIWIDAGANINKVQGDSPASDAVVYINDNGRGKHQFNHDKRVEHAKES